MITKALFPLTCAITLLAFTGCKSISSSGAVNFSAGVTTAKTQSGETFRTINDLVAADQLEDAAKATNLTEQLFTKVLNPEDIAVWDQSFAKLESYAQHLQSLDSPDVANSFVQEAENLGGELKTFGQNLKQTGLIASAPEISAGLATAFTELGSIIIRAKAHHDALRIASAANSNVVTIFRVMSAGVGDTSKTGLRGTSREHWLGRLAVLKQQFKKQSDETGKREIAEKFVAMMEQRDAQDAALASLRRSLLGLAAMHQSLSKGDSASVAQLAQMLSQEMKATRDIHSQFQSNLNH